MRHVYVQLFVHSKVRSVEWRRGRGKLTMAEYSPMKTRSGGLKLCSAELRRVSEIRPLSWTDRTTRLVPEIELEMRRIMEAPLQTIRNTGGVAD